MNMRWLGWIFAGVMAWRYLEEKGKKERATLVARTAIALYETEANKHDTV